MKREYPIASVHADTPMSEEYRRTLVRKLADQARAELAASHLYSRWVRKAPGPEEKLLLASLAREETDHWYRTVRLLAELGVPHDQLSKVRTRDVFIPVFRVLAGRLKWLDVLMISFLIDKAAYYLVEDFAQSSYAPWKEMAEGILEEEQGHPEFGIRFLEEQIRRHGSAAVQKALNKWWRVALNMCGPSNSPHDDLYLRLGLKFRSNDERRELYRRETEPMIEKLGLRVPKLYRGKYPFI